MSSATFRVLVLTVVAGFLDLGYVNPPLPMPGFGESRRRRIQCPYCDRKMRLQTVNGKTEWRCPNNHRKEASGNSP